MNTNKLILALALMLCVVLTGCNTTKGIGQDLGKAGEKIEETAKKKGADD